MQRSADQDKRYSWPAYATVLRAKVKHPVWLVVVALDPAVAKWAGQPIVLGPGSVFTPIVITSAHVPMITNLDTARQLPELAVLSAIAHGASSHAQSIGRTVLDALSEVDPERAQLYCDLVLQAVNEYAREVLEALMLSGQYQFQSDLAKRLRAEGEQVGVERGLQQGLQRGLQTGRQEGIKSALLTILESRLGTIPQESRQQILSCSDTRTLQRWLQRAAIAGELREVLDL